MWSGLADSSPRSAKRQTFYHNVPGDVSRYEPNFHHGRHHAHNSGLYNMQLNALAF